MQKGIPVSPGIAVGRVYICEGAQDLRRQVEHTTAHDFHTEWLRLKDAARRSDRELANLVEEVRAELGDAEAAIFESQRVMLRDGAVEKEMREILEHAGVSAEKALATVIEKYQRILSSAHDEYLRARAADIRDVGQRSLSILLDEDQEALIAQEEHVVVVARQVIPSRMLGLLKQKVAGVVTDRGSRTSHAAILCRSYGIAAVTGVGNILDKVSLGDMIAVDLAEFRIEARFDCVALADHAQRGEQLARVADIYQPLFGAVQAPCVHPFPVASFAARYQVAALFADADVRFAHGGQDVQMAERRFQQLPHRLFNPVL